MAFILVFVQKVNDRTSPLYHAWGLFHTYAKVDALKETAGVFYIDETAWIFDTRTALPELGLMIHQAHEQNMQLHSFQLDSATLRSHVASSPRSEKMEAFLGS